MMKATIVVLTYKNFDYIEKNLQSIFQQSYKNIEIVLRDDGSENFDAHKINNIFEDCPDSIEYKVIHDEVNHGTVYSFNRTIEASDGDVIIPLAGDDYFLTDDVVYQIVNYYEQHPDCLVLTARERHIQANGKKVVLPDIIEELMMKKGSLSTIWYSISARPNYIVGSATSYRRKVFQLYGKFDEKYRLLEDWPYYLHLFENGVRIYSLPYIIIEHSNGGVSGITEGHRNRYLIEDDLLCLNDVISKQDMMSINRYQKKSLLYRKMKLKQEIENTVEDETNRRFTVLLILEFVQRKIHGLSRKIDWR